MRNSTLVKYSKLLIDSVKVIIMFYKQRWVAANIYYAFSLSNIFKWFVIFYDD